MTSYPEHEKLSEIKDKSQFVGAFIVWYMDSQHGQMMILRETIEQRDKEEYKEKRWVFEPRSIERLLADYFGIDYQKLDAEKDQMIKAFQTASK